MSNSLQPHGLELQISSVHEISQARIVEWIAISSSKDIPDPRIEPVSPALAGRFVTIKPPGKTMIWLICI